MPKPMLSDVSKVSKTFGTINEHPHNETSSGLPEVPIVASCFVEEIADASSLRNT